MAAVADAFDANAVAVDPEVAAHGGADAVEDVLGFIAVLVAEDGVGEGLAVAGRAAVVDHESRPAAGGVGF
ncbi:MAG: hypothetical protein SFV54_19180 [Bryobacteraceae bacterium]|nr:hypothetical protein [Bryobacteraceae bacterium]